MSLAWQVWCGAGPSTSDAVHRGHTACSFGTRHNSHRNGLCTLIEITKVQHSLLLTGCGFLAHMESSRSLSIKWVPLSFLHLSTLTCPLLTQNSSHSSSAAASITFFNILSVQPRWHPDVESEQVAGAMMKTKQWKPGAAAASSLLFFCFLA